MSFLRQRRVELVQSIVEKDPTRFGYLTTEPFATNIGSNYQTFPNDFLEAFYQYMLDFPEYYVEVISQDEKHGAKFQEFVMTYQQCYQQWALQQQQYYAFVAQQQQYQAQLQAQGQQFVQPQQYPAQQNYGQQQGQYNNQQRNYQHHQNQYPNNQQRQNTGQNYQGVNNQHGQNYDGQQQRQYHRQNPNYQQNQDQNQGHQRNYQQNNQQQNRPKQYNNRYPNQQGNYEGQQQGQHYQQNRHYNNHHQGHYQQRHHQYGHHQHQPYDNVEQTGQQVQVVPEVTQVVAPPQPPPKPQPQPKKFSLQQIQQFISQWSDKDKQLVDKELVEKVNEVNGWTKGETSFDEKPQKPQQERKYDNKNRREPRGENQSQQQGFSTGSKFNKQPQPLPELVKKDTGLKIVVGKNQTLEAKMIKKEIKEKAGQDFASLKEKENLSLDQVGIAKKQIIYNLNLLAPENLKDIQKDLTKYLFDDETICFVLVQQIIEKAWGQPKYASTYAKLCSEFSKIGAEKFTFNSGKEKKKENPFKVFLISKVQHSFDKKVEEVPEFQNDDEKDNWLKETKKKILGNVKFIAELIRSKVLKKKIMKICISQLLFTFLAKYYYWRKTAKIVDSYFDYYFEALIEFIENVGEYYEKMDETSEKKQEKTQPFEPAQSKIIDLIEMNQKPPEDEIEEITNLKAEDYFKIFNIIDEKILRKKNTRLSALLLNLAERRNNNWQKHHAESQGPKKLKEIKQDIAKEQEEMNKVKAQKKQNMEHLHDLIKAMFKDWDKGERNQKAHFKAILKEYNMVEFLTACFNQVSDEKKQFLVKRLELIDIILENYFDLDKLKAAWVECVKFMAFNSGDYPFAPATIALVLKKILAKESSKLKEFYYKTQDEDEEYFVNDVFGRLYHYTKQEEIKEFVEPSKKYGNMLEV